MTGALVERQAALAAVALLAALSSLAIGRNDDSGATRAEPSPPGATQAWNEASVGVYGAGLYGTQTACDTELTPDLAGVAHPVLPCGARIVVEYGGRRVETRVVDRGVKVEGQAFALTEALANELGLSGTQTVRWRFSSGG
jgi:rare lipoprotein A (peptidoglycan hydrolase)